MYSSVCLNRGADSCLHERDMAVATISLFVLCEDSCGGADHFPCLACLYIVACSERDMTYATILVRVVYFITVSADKES